MKIFGVACLALLPLQWFVVAGSPVGGSIRVHQVGIFVLTIGVLVSYGLKHSADIIHRFRVFLIANAYMYITWAAVTVYSGMVPVEPISEMVYMVIFLAISTYFYLAALSADRGFVETLRWTGPATLAVLLVGLTLGSIQNGVDIFGVIRASLVAVDPQIIEFQLFRRVFGGFGYESEEVRTNFRHEIFGGLLFSMYVTGWAHSRVPFVGGLQSLVYRATMVLGAGLLLVSLSRSIIIAAAIWPLLLIGRALVTGRVSKRNQFTGIAVLAGAVVMSLAGVWDLLMERFLGETNSYETRAGNVGLALETIRENFWLGQPDLTGETSAHNFVLDAWSSAGVFVGIPALIVFVTVYALWAAMLIRVPSMPDELLPVTAALGLPAIRLVTQGGGLLAIVEWVTLGFVAGVLVAAYRTAQVESAADTSHRIAVAAARAAAARAVGPRNASVAHPSAVPPPRSRPTSTRGIAEPVQLPLA